MIFKDTSKNSLLCSLEDKQLVKLTREISRKFTSERLHIEDYTKNEELVSAYSWFYLPTNKHKLGSLLGQIPSKISDVLFKMTFIDFGCGPGTFSWALADYLRYLDKECPNLVLIDSSPTMLKQARKIHANDYSDVQIINFFSTAPIEPVKNSFLFFGHSLNEMNFDNFVNTFKTIKPLAVAFIEPGTRDSFGQITKVRNYLIKAGYSNEYPCPTNGECPAAKAGDWCHQLELPNYQESVLRKCQMTGLDRRSLPMIAHLYLAPKLVKELNKSNLPVNKALIYRYLGESKGGLNFQLCVNYEDLTIINAEVTKRTLDKDSIKKIKKLTPGLYVNYTIEKILSNGTWRLSNISKFEY